MKTLCIYNPKAGNGKAIKQLNDIKSLFKKNTIDADIVLTQYPHHGTSIIKEIKNLENYDAVIAAGGDGTVFDVVNGLLKYHKETKITVGIIPVGTGNSLSNDIKTNNNSLEAFIEIIANKTTKKIDVLKAQTDNDCFYFINILGFGFSTDVTLDAIKFKMFGETAYTLSTLYNTLKLNTYELEIEVNGEKRLTENLFVSILNTRYGGGNFLLAPKAKLNDGLMDVIIVNKVGRLQLLKTFTKVFDGSYINSPFVEYLQVSKIKFSSKSSKVLSPDGEIMHNLPVEIEVMPNEIEIFSL